jgi:hypothetical protein
VDFFDDKVAAGASLALCPKLTSICAAVNTAAADWFATRPDTKF